MRESPYSDLERPPLNAAALRRALIVPYGLWTRLDLRTETGSTNVDAADAARGGEPEGLVVVAERQDAGRGRRGRSWASPARAGITVSVLLRPGEAVPGREWRPAPMPMYGWLPLLAGVALVESVRRIAEVDALLKWPNDLLVRGTAGDGPARDGGRLAGYGKCAGILAETVPGDDRPPAVVVGIGLNVTLRAGELPDGVGGLPVTSLGLAGAVATDRDPLLRSLLRSFASWYGRWREACGEPDGSGLRPAYQEACGTIGQRVRVLLPSGGDLSGVASGIDGDGRLRVRTADGEQSVSAGDVLHVR